MCSSDLHFDQAEIIGEVAFNFMDGGDFLVELGALAHQRLRFPGIIPKRGILREGV